MDLPPLGSELIILKNRLFRETLFNDIDAICKIFHKNKAWNFVTLAQTSMFTRGKIVLINIDKSDTF